MLFIPQSQKSPAFTSATFRSLGGNHLVQSTPKGMGIWLHLLRGGLSKNETDLKTTTMFNPIGQWERESEKTR